MTAKRGFRIVMALLVLVIFGLFAWSRAYVSPTTADLNSEDGEFHYTQWQQPSPPLDGWARRLGIPVPDLGLGEQPVPQASPAQTTDPAETEAQPAQSAAPAAEPAETEALPEETVDPNSPAAKAAALGLPAPPDIDPDSWEFTLVNGDHSIGEYAPEQLAYLNQTLSETDIQLSYNGNRCPVDARIADALIAFGQACKESGLTVFLSSGYRSYSDQAANFDRICRNNGVSDGKDSKGHYITMPAGCSEHQLALCCDITDRYYEVKNASIEQTQTYQWLLEHCAEYGFIQRFPAGKEDITGVMYEPWHFRFVGVPAAQYMKDNDLTLEEFLGLYGVE